MWGDLLNIATCAVCEDCARVVSAKEKEIIEVWDSEWLDDRIFPPDFDCLIFWIVGGIKFLLMICRSPLIES